MLATKYGYLSLIPGIHRVEWKERTSSGNLPSDPHTHAGASVQTYDKHNVFLKRRALKAMGWPLICNLLKGKGVCTKEGGLEE